MKKKYIIWGLFILILAGLTGCSGGGNGSSGAWKKMKPKSHMDLSYATQFTVDYYDGGYALITISGEDRYLLVPEGFSVPEGLDEGITVIKKPVNATYLAASSAMDFYRKLDALDQVTMTSTKSSDWSFPEVQEALANENMLYVGKYSSPDYETIIDENCGLVIESTMIYHCPEIKEKLEQMGIPVMVEHSSYETDPLGRMEWIKLYGLLCNKEGEAETFFNEQIAELQNLLTDKKTGKTVSFFYISSAGYVNVRKPGDYISKMIEQAGGTYVLDDMEMEEGKSMSTLNMQMEDFYSRARDADIMIYNSTIEGNLESVDQLIAKNKLFKDFKAVKDENVWCTGSNVFQETTGAAGMISELYAIIHDKVADEEEMEFMHRVK